MGQPEHGRIEPFDAPEIVVDRRDIGTGPRADLLAGRAIEAFFGKNVAPRFEQRRARALRLFIVDRRGLPRFCARAERS